MRRGAVAASRPRGPGARGGRAAAKATVRPGETVLVAGATGGVGQLLAAKLLQKGFRVRALVRDPAKAETLLGAQPDLEFVQGDLRSPADLARATAGVAGICCTTGTTAFPSARWKGNNTPEMTDFVGVKNLVNAAPAGLSRFVLVSSVGVERYEQPSPYMILNLFGVLENKKKGEDALVASGVPYTIFRPGRLTDGPYTSYDLNTLLQGIAGERQDVTVALGDCLDGEMSRIALAEGVANAIQFEHTSGQTYCCMSVDGDGPGEDAEKWSAMLMVE